MTSSDATGCLVRARAQVMTRDVGTGLWRPLSGGGMSVVELSRMPKTVAASAAVATHDEEDTQPVTLLPALSSFRIEGRKVANNDVSLETLSRGLVSSPS